MACSQTALEVALAQWEPLRPLLPEGVRVLAECWSPTRPFLPACQRLAVSRSPTCADGHTPKTWGEPDESWQADPGVRQACGVEVAVSRVVHEYAKGRRRDPVECWVCRVGPAPGSRMSTPLAFSHRICAGPQPVDALPSSVNAGA